MKKNELYSVMFENNFYNLRIEQVEQLLLVSKFYNSNIELIVKLKDGMEINGHVVDFYGYNPLVPYDIHIPLSFSLKTSEIVIQLNFLQIEWIKVNS